MARKKNELTKETSFVPDKDLRDKVFRLALIKVPLAEITSLVQDILNAQGECVEVTEEWIEKTFYYELSHTANIAKSNVAMKLYQNAYDKNDIVAQMFFLRHFTTIAGEETGQVDDNVILIDQDMDCEMWSEKQCKTKKKPKNLQSEM